MRLIHIVTALAIALPITSALIDVREAQATTVTSSQPFLVNTFTSLSSTPANATDTSAAFFAQTTTPSSSPAAGTSIAVFTIGPAQYTATVVSSIVLVAGYQLQVGGGAGLIGGVAVSAASSGLLENGQLIKYTEITGAASTSLAPASTTLSATTTDSSSSSTAASVASTSTSSRGSAPVATALPFQAVVAMCGVAMAVL